MAPCLASLPRAGRGPVTPAPDLLKDGDRSEEDHECQNAEELEIAAEIRKDAGTLRPGWGGRRVFAESGRVNAGIRVAAGSGQGGERPPATAVVVVDLLEGPGREAQRQVIRRHDRRRPAARFAHATHPVDVPPDLDARRRGGRVRVGRNRALHARRAGRGLEGARAKIYDDLVVARLA